jgi:outer membrane protein OmpA-like peptidoglycan-associated protein
MNIDSEPRTISTALAGLLAVVVGLLLAACATPVPVATASAPSAVPTQQAAQAALKSLNFDPQADAYHLSLPAPLIFPFDSTELSPEAHANLRRVGRELNEIGIDRALVWGYTDNVGPTQYNLALSLRRAEIVAQAIIEGGYPATQVAVKGLGASLPIAGNGTAQGRSQNRRVVIIVQLP